MIKAALAACALLGLVQVAAASETIVNWGLTVGAEPRPLCVYDTNQNCVQIGKLNSTTHVFYPSETIGGADPFTPPFQVGASTVGAGFAGIYADSGSGNIFQNSTWVRNSGTRNTVATLTFTDSTGPNSRGWGLNTGFYGNNATAAGQSIEADFASQVAGSVSYGVVIAYAGSQNDAANYLLMANASIAGVAPHDGIIITNAGNQPLQASGTLFKTFGNVQVANGVDFTTATFSGTAFASTGFSVDGTGHISIATGTPASAAAACTTGTFEWGSAFLYICVGTNTWKRVAVATW